MVLLDLLTLLGVAIDTPVDQARNVLILVVLRPASLSRPRGLIITRFLEALLLNSILDIEAVGAASLVTNEKFATSIIQTDASDVCLRDVMEDILQAAICSVPDFHTGRMRCDKSVEDGIVEDAKTGIFVRQVMVDRLIVVVEDETSAADNDSLGRLCNGQSVDLVQAAVERLRRRVGPHVPHADHARDVRADDLLRASDPLDTDQTVVVPLHEEDSRLDLRVPHVDVMVETRTQDHVHVRVPVQRMHSQLMALREFVLEREIVHFPESDDFVHAARGQVAHRWDRK